MITVITVTWNARNIIEKTIKSILNQKDCEFELIVKDGLSNDGTIDYINELRSLIPSESCKVQIVSAKDNSIYDAMNQAVSKASGDYVIFMNGGDAFYSDDALARFEEYIKESPDYDAYYGNTMMNFYEGRGVLEWDEEHGDPIMPFIHQSVIVKRSILQEHPFDLSYKIVADRELFNWMRNNNMKFKHCDFIVSDYDAREGLSENNPLRIRYEVDRIEKRNQNKWYWLRKIKLRLTVGLIQPIKDYAPRYLLNIYFRKKKKHIRWVEFFD